MNYQTYTSPSTTGATGRTKVAVVAAICGLILAGCAGGADKNSNSQEPTNNAISANEFKVTLIGGGTGAVAWSSQTDGGGVFGNCAGGTCFQSVPQGTVLTLTATPATGTQFLGWLGACTGTGACSVTMDNNKFVGAAFSSSGNPPVIVSVTGFGNVTSSAGGLSCGTAGSVCTVEAVQPVTLTAVPDSAQTFLGWAGACASAGTATTCTLASGTGPAMVTALFSGEMLRMDVALTGAGVGNVVSSPAGISCGGGILLADGGPNAAAGATCGAPFTPGTVVTLTASPKTGNVFTGWSGACQGTAVSGNVCTLTLDDNKSAVATFAKASVGNALVVFSAEPAGTNCTNGGQKIQAGMDSDSDGTLDPAEIVKTSYVCSPDGIITVSLSQSAEPAGANCVNGGVAIQSNVAPTTSYVCNNPGLPTANPGVNVSVTSVMPSTTLGQFKVRFKLTDNLGNPISVQGTYSQNLAITPKFALAYYTTDANGNASPFSVYTIQGGSPTALSGTLGSSLVENGWNAGDYTYTFPSSVAYDGTKANEKHVIWIEVARQTNLSKVCRGYPYNDPPTSSGCTNNAATFYATNQPYYFIPATGAAAAARELVKAENCFKCHDTKFKIESSTALAFHYGARNNGTYCNVCHNPGNAKPEVNSKVYIHRIHGAEALNPNNLFDGLGAFAFPQTTANCNACHGTAAQGAQAQNVPTQQACSSCHDNVKFDQSASAVCSGVMTAGTAYTTGVALSIAASTGSAAPYTSVITRPSGSFLTDGFAVGQAVGITGTVSNNVHMQITAVTDTTMTLSGVMQTVVETSPTTAYINAYAIPVACNHPGPALADDSQCASCHSPSGTSYIGEKHVPIAEPDPKFTWFVGGTVPYSGAAWVAASGQVPPGASKFTYDLQSVSTWTDSSGNVRPQAIFRILKDGVRADFQTYVAGSVTELYAGFMGSPSAYFAWAMPQDTVTAPSEFNVSASCYIRNAWNGSAASTCTLSGPDLNGYYTVKMVGGKALPATATMLTGGIGYTYGATPPLTQTNLPAYPTAAPGTVLGSTGLTCSAPTGYLCGGLIVPAPDVWKVATGFTARRPIVDNEKCKNCHGALGIEPNFHVGQRNDGPTCSFCHTANQTSSGWSAGSRYYIHAIHGGRVRTTPFTWHAATPGPGYSEVEYPSPLNDCQTCHLPGTNQPVNAKSNLPTTVGTGTYSASFTNSPYVTLGTNYGAGFTVATTGLTATEAAGTTLVISPITTVCSSCHDTTTAIAHMRGKGGRFYEPRSTYLTDVATGTSEQCLNCHAQLNH